jgi:hypothetical protein
VVKWELTNLLRLTIFEPEIIYLQMEIASHASGSTSQFKVQSLFTNHPCQVAIGAVFRHPADQ